MADPNFEKDFITTTPNYVKSLKYDLPAGLVVFLIALPLCLSIALASGAPIFSGIIAGVVGGVIVGLLSGSPLGVSGPAAGLVAICLEAINGLGFEVFIVAVVISGVMQIALGYAKAGIIGYYFPSSVIKGMLTGIGIILILKQIPHALGDDRDYIGDENFLESSGGNSFTAIIEAIQNFHPGALITSITCLTILILWQTKFFKKTPILNVIPGPLVAVLAGVYINVWLWGQTAWLNEIMGIAAGSKEWIDFGLNNSSVTNKDHLVALPLFNNFSSFLNIFQLPDFETAFSSTKIGWKVFVTALTIAIVGSLETLLSVEAIDKLDPFKRVTPTNRELKAQGVGNIISGFLGGLPVTQVIVRSSANIATKGKTKVSAVVHGVLLLFCVYTITEYLNMIPLSALAAILLIVGFKLAKPTLFAEMYKKGWDQFFPFIITVVAIVFTNLLIGIMIGMGVGVFYVLRSNYRTPFYFHKEKHHEGDIFTINLSEEVSFLNKASIMIMLEELPSNSKVTIDGSKSNMIDKDVLEIIENFVAHAPLKNIKIKITGIEGLNQDDIERRIRFDIDDREELGSKISDEI